MSFLNDFIHAADQLVKYNSVFSQLPEAKHSLLALQARKMELKDLWADVKSKYMICIREGWETADFDAASIEEKYSSSNETFISCYVLMLEWEGKLSKAIDSNSTSSGTVPVATPDNTTHLKSYGVKLPVCDTETFSGDYLKWPTFRDMFEAIYIKHPRLGEVEKLFHLRSKTTGDAFSIVEKFPLLNSSFELAWEALRSTYENKRIIINNQVKTLLNLPSCPTESGKAIKNLQRHINDCLAALKAHGVNIFGWDPILVYTCSNRLPPNTLSLWEQSLADPTAIPSWKQMDKFLNARFQVLETIADVTSPAVPISEKIVKTQKNFSQPRHRVNTFHSKPQMSSCKLCSGNHLISKCSQFLAMTPSARYEIIRKNHMCVNCLSAKHSSNACQSHYSCSSCNKRHNSLLHFPTSSNSPVSNVVQNSSSTPIVGAPSAPQNHSSSQLQSTSQSFVPSITGRTHFASSDKKVLLATARVNIIGQDSYHIVRALIDPGSEVSFMLESVQRRFNLPTFPINISISSVNATHAASSKKLCTFSIYNGENPAVPITAQAIVLKQITNDLPSTSFSNIDPSDLRGLNLADPSFNSSAQIDLLIGADLYPAIVRNGLQQVCETLVAQNTVFGWILSGPLPKTVHTFSTFVTEQRTDSLDEQIKQFWELEEVHDGQKILSAEDQYCEDFYAKTTVQRPNGQYVVRLPFKPTASSTPLGTSRGIALKQFLRTETNLTRKPDLQLQYSNVISEYLNLGHMRKVNNVEKVNNGTISSFYLPHHAVLKPDSASTKVRVVFNASSASTSGVSLNDLLYTGPVLQRDLASLIIRWRFFKFVFNADIEKMYRQIAIHPDDTIFQRILYRFPSESTVNDYELLTVTFGVNCAPYLAIRTLLQLAKDKCNEYPLASQIISSECYVDDILSGAHDLPTAQRAQRELIALLDSGGFPLRKWTSNTTSLLDHLPPTHVLSENFLKLDKDITTKTLGIRWNAKKDYFYFTTPSFKLSTTPSKREVFSQIAQLFDPAGWLAPIIVRAKMLMQRIWVEATEWDNVIQSDTYTIWQSFVETLSDIREIQIPRWLEYSPSDQLQIHGFCDSSEKAYSAALYVRIEKPDGVISSHLICAKSKVAPIKPVSLPRLELCGAVLLSKLVRAQLPNFPVSSYQTYFWTDSSIVLAWLNKHPSTWKTFVANRTSEIIGNIGNTNWNHVRSAENPADLATRGLSPKELQLNNLWWNGPSWLREPQQLWPSTPPEPLLHGQLEQKTVSCFVEQIRSNDVLERFSSLPRALRVLTYLFRFRYNSDTKTKITIFRHNTTNITQQEMNFVRTRLILLSQKFHYPREHDSLVNGKPLSSKSSILSLNPCLDSDQILRVNGRLTNSNLTYAEKHPIIIPYSSHLAKLLIDFIHDLTLHGGNALMLSVTRRMFWIPKLNNLIKFCIRQCKTCVIHKKQLRTQIMAALPTERCTFSPPFTYTGVDFAGPFLIKSYLGRSCRITKGYVCLFVCFATKAIHLEAASDLSSQVFLAAFARFVARRGLPKEMFSDHGTNFTGANVMLQREFKKFLESSSNETRLKYGVQGLEWNFIPPGAPHMGGLWEAGVKSLKSHLRKLGDTSKFTFEEFSTVLARIEACLNSRPISPMSNDPLDPLALTPGHFLRGSPLLTFPEPYCNENSLSLVNRWEKLKCLQQQFCQRWKEEYLKELHKRFKWQFPEENVKVNDLVVVKQENLPCNEWRIGRVIKVCPGIDGMVRVATVKTQHGEITRPVVKLCVLPNT